MELMIAFHWLLKGLKDKAHQVPCLNIQYILAISILLYTHLLWSGHSSLHTLSTNSSAPLSGFMCGADMTLGNMEEGVPLLVVELKPQPQLMSSMFP